MKLKAVTNAGGRDHQPSTDTGAKRGTAHRRLYVEVTENAIGGNDGIGFPKRLFEQLSDLHVKCTNPDCRDGGVFLGPIIREMLQNEETKQLFVEMCPGRVRLHGHRLGWVRCQKMFCIKVLLA
ncbi:MAG: hypothetical protein R3268_03075 [Acidiferrobacterales bacterium]|nr:hypothetical protein [Acidiferrobacterales bacterium]